MKQMIFLMFFGITAVISAQITGATFSNMYNISTGTLLYNPGGEALESEDSEVAARLTLKVFKGYGRVPLTPLNPHLRCMPYEKMKAENDRTWYNKDDKGRNVWTFEQFSDSQYVVKNEKYNVALTAKGENEIVPEPFKEGNNNQIFIMSRVQKDFRYAFYLKTKSGKTAVTSNSSGTLVYQRPFAKGNRNQMWVISDRFRFTSATELGHLAPPENVDIKPGVKLGIVRNRDKPIVQWNAINHPTGDWIFYLQHAESGLFLAYPESDTSGAIGFNATLQDYDLDYKLLFVFRGGALKIKSTYGIVVYPNEKECLAYTYDEGILGELFVPADTLSKSQLWKLTDL